MSISARDVATIHRKKMHGAVAEDNLSKLREAVHNLYDDKVSPLLGKNKSVNSDVRAYAPVVEAYVLATLFLDEDSDVREECTLNFLHTHIAFGLSKQDYDAIVKQVVELGDDDGDDMWPLLRSVDWCVNTPLHKFVKPWRHENLFKRDE